MSLSYAYLSINILSLAVIIAGIAAVIHWRDRMHSSELLLVLLFIFIGSFSIFIESAVSGYENKLLWRNISQIGLFLLPSVSFNFIMLYTKTESSFFHIIRRINFIYASICVLLIFTNDFHHIMRISVDFIQNDTGMVLRVRQSIAGKVFVALNTLMSLSAMIKLWVFMRSISKASRVQVRFVMAGFLIPIIFTYARSAILTTLGIFIPIPLSFMAGILFMLLGMYRYDLMAVSPIARDWVIDEIDIGMIFTRPDGTIADINHYVTELFGEPDSVRLFLERNPNWLEAIRRNRSERFEIDLNVSSEDKTYSVQVHDLRKRKHSLGTVSLLRDITAEKHLHSKLIRLAETDRMTKVLNREAFISRVSGIIDDCQDTEMSCSLFIIDIDNFKQINDTYGHMMGDEVIREIVTVINDICRQQDYVGRLGGDEFTVFLLDADKTTSGKIAERINSSIRGRTFISGSLQFNATVSIGIVNTIVSGTNFEHLYEQADMALLDVKGCGKNSFSFY